MDPSAYKTHTVSREITYSYYFKAPSSEKPYLLFIHGFPNTSSDWRHQAPFFAKEGYGLIVPDMLGYAGTSPKPTNPEAYKGSLICKDLVEILDKEAVGNSVIAIGHDWGSKFISRFANYYPDRFAGFAFLAVGYIAPNVGEPNIPFEQYLAFTKQFAGYELFGYWKFFSKPEADKVIESHIDSFMSLLYAQDASLWKTHFAPTGAFEQWLLEDKKTAVAEYVTSQEVEAHKQTLLKGGLAGPLCYYKVHTSDIDYEDSQGIPKENIPVSKPTFFGGTLRDYVCIPTMQKPQMEKLCSKLTYKEYDTSHWGMLENPEQFNRDLLAWIQGITNNV